ncbi:hypothetical protein [Roseofilum casamattae]|uniref:Uncharacterized protein n=1 Tax=Roseofilum casamattae BLCC-M143 TaxID=3022442 RepID=A0ABT7BZM7_9CYAN|nr:hypothetical protein [Roseofilum casamattae]MDJ1184664.1 hypothetical protein [Roseofilum casamattae BLCC-M143]
MADAILPINSIPLPSVPLGSFVPLSLPDIPTTGKALKLKQLEPTFRATKCSIRTRGKALSI